MEKVKFQVVDEDLLPLFLSGYFLLHGKHLPASIQLSAFAVCCSKHLNELFYH